MSVKNVISKMVILAAILLWGLSYVYDEVKAADTGDLTYEEGAKEYVPTDEDLALEQRKMEELYSSTSPLTEGFKSLPVTCYEQETGHYCGPATVKQVVHYLTGIEKPQDYFAELLGTTSAGTDFSSIPGVLNSEIGEDHYVYSSIQNQNIWYARIKLSSNNGYPVVLDINTKNISEFPYSVTGHIVNTSGYNEVQSPITVRITDPYGPGLGNQWYTIDSLYGANSAHSRMAMIW